MVTSFMVTSFMVTSFASEALPGLDPLQARQLDAREELREAVEHGVKLFPCGFTIAVFGYAADDFIEGAQPRLGSADFLEYAADADITLFV